MSKEWPKPEVRKVRDEPIGGQIKACSLLSDVEVAELVEVVTHAGAEQKQAVKARKQYVNLDAEMDPDQPHPEFGRRIRLKARIKWKAGDASRSLAGKLVFWSAKALAKWRSSDMAESDAEGFGSAGSGLYIWASPTDAAGWTPVVEFYLSQYGGDEFEVYASSTLGLCSGPKAGPYTVWRRLFYDIAEMKTADGDDKYSLSEGAQYRLKEGFADVFIELEDTGKRHLGDYRENFEDDYEAAAWANQNCSPDRVPLKVHYCVVDRYCERKSITQLSVDEVVYHSPFTSIHKIFPHEFSGAKWIVKLEYLREGKFVPLDAQVRLDGARGFRKFIVDFSGTPVTPTPEAQVLIRLTYLMGEPALGLADDDTLHVMICKGVAGDVNLAYDSDIANTCIHETGHALGLVSREMKWRFRSKEHHGHCRLSKCVMWWQHSEERLNRFHNEQMGNPGCRTHLRGKALDRATMKPHWDFHGEHAPILFHPRKI
jgi:hypothetical protein